MPRVSASFLWAPITGSLLGAVAMAPFVPMQEGLVAFMILFASVAAGLAILLTLVVALPAIALLRQRGVLTIGTFLLLSGVVATIGVALVQVALVSFNRSWPEPSPWPPTFVVVFAATCALVTAAILWRVVKVESAA
jgi:hypothetical protein